jgi:uncharacterized protein YicC (UPF0701 family)
VIRRAVRRGTIQVHVHCDRQHAPQDFRINGTALKSYLDQLRALGRELNLRAAGTAHFEPEALLAHVLALPGVVAEPGASPSAAEEGWPIFKRVLEQALARLQAMRQEEGRAMAQELLQLRDQIAGQLASIRQRSPRVVLAFRTAYSSASAAC